MNENQERARQAYRAMEFTYPDAETDVVELLRDLMHYCQQDGECFESRVKKAAALFNTDIMEEQNHERK